MKSIVLLVTVALTTSGCVGGQEADTTASPPPATQPTLAEEPLVTYTEGVIRGLVHTDELLPLAGVNVTLEKADRFAITDELGAFTFNLLQPGTYNVAAQVQGYASAAKRIEALAGVVTWTNFTLVALASTAVYVDVIPRSVFIDIGQFQLENSVLRPAGQGCKDCMVPFTLGANYRQFRAEYSFRATPDYPQTEEVLCYHLYRNTTNPAPTTTTDEFIETRCLANRGNVTYATPTVLKLPEDRITWYVTPDRLPSYQQRLDIWFSISHNGDIPTGHTALAPPA